jgi:hypothetical protein
MKPHLTHFTFADTVIAKASVAHFAGRSIFTQWRSSGFSGGLTSIYPSGDPRAVKKSRWRRQVIRGFLDEAVLTEDVC